MRNLINTPRFLPNIQFYLAHISFFRLLTHSFVLFCKRNKSHIRNALTSIDVDVDDVVRVKKNQTVLRHAL